MVSEHQHVALKVYTREGADPDELDVYNRLGKRSSHHGYPYLRTSINRFTIRRPGGDGDHQCLVQKAMWDSFRDLLFRNPSHRFTEDLLKGGLMQILLALDCLHREYQIVHTGASNICFLRTFRMGGG